MVANSSQFLKVLDSDESQPLAEVSEREGNLRMVCFMIAQGESVESTARKLDLTETYVQGCISSARGADMVVRIQGALFPDVKLRIERLANLALDRKVKLMLTSTNDAVVNSVTTDILDRTLGKAIQITENRNLNLNMNDANALDRAIAAQQEKLKKLEAIELRLKPLD